MMNEPLLTRSLNSPRVPLMKVEYRADPVSHTTPKESRTVETITFAASEFLKEEKNRFMLGTDRYSSFIPHTSNGHNDLRLFRVMLNL